MTFHGKFLTAAVAAALTTGATLPASSTSEAATDPVIASEAPQAALPIIAVPQIPVVEAPAAAPAATRAAAPAAAPGVISAASDTPARTARQTASTEIDSDLECLAKVVLHEAGNQSRAGQIAVAEVVMNRLQDPRGRFGRSICGVVMQRGQFFNVHAYNAQRDRRWPAVVAIAREVRENMIEGDHDHVTNGGLFFRAAHGAPFRGRTRTAVIQDHMFYR